MGLLIALTVGLILWIVGWTFGIKSIDAFFVVILLLLVALTVRVAGPFVRRQLGRE